MNIIYKYVNGQINLILHQYHSHIIVHIQKLIPYTATYEGKPRGVRRSHDPLKVQNDLCFNSLYLMIPFK
jgi:hypothetical protein